MAVTARPVGTSPSAASGSPSEGTAGEGTTGLDPRDPSPVELGRRIKALRVARGLTLKDLEVRGGISATHVSEIERGRASPTVGALGRIARALGLRPANLIEPSVLPEFSVTRAPERPARRVRMGSAAVEPVTGPVEGAMLGAHLVMLPAGQEPVFSHRHEGEEWAMALTGTAEVRVDGEPYLLREGDSIHFRAHHEHSYSNLALTPTVLLVADRPRLSL